MLFLVMLITPFVLFIAGAYVLHYPLTIAVLYGFNLALMYVFLWAVGNQVLKVYSQKMSISEENLILFRKELFLKFPMIGNLDLEIPLNSIIDFSLQQTRIGYLLALRFNLEGKTMGVDLDLNPLKPENSDVLTAVLASNSQITVNEETNNILDNFTKKALAWKGSYLFSFLVLGLALVIFFVVSVYLGTKVH